MPLYTYVLTHRGNTVVLQESRSNYRGWMSEVIARAFPNDAKSIAIAYRQKDPEPVDNLSNVWQWSAEMADTKITVSIIETKR